MEITDIDLKNLNDQGFIIKKNILSDLEIERIKAEILKNKSGKGGVRLIILQIINN
jgi:hypothetical protein